MCAHLKNVIKIIPNSPFRCLSLPRVKKLSREDYSGKTNCWLFSQNPSCLGKMGILLGNFKAFFKVVRPILTDYLSNWNRP